MTKNPGKSIPPTKEAARPPMETVREKINTMKVLKTSGQSDESNNEGEK
jgi:hypothetical protein